MQQLKFLTLLLLSFNVFRLNAQVTFSPPVCYPIGASPMYIISGDFNNDGLADMATSNTGENSVSIILGIGKGVFASGNTYSVGAYPQHITAADFNMDGNLDLVVANAQSHDISLLLGLGNGIMSPAAYIPVGSYPMGIQSADFNSDGKIDIAVSLSGESRIALLMGNGTGGFLPVWKFPVGGVEPNTLICGDFNNDGKPDLVSGNAGSSDISVMLNTGTGNFLAPQIIFQSVFLAPVFIQLAGKIDSDGNTDLIITDLFGATVVFYGDGSGNFNFPLTWVNVGPALNTPKCIADFDGDGLIDIGSSGSPSSKLMVAMGDTGVTNFSSYLSFTDTCFMQPKGVVAIDVNGDGRTDLVAAENWGKSIVVYLNSTPVRINQSGIQNEKFIVFPNPMTNLLNFNNQGEYCDLYNVMGQRVSTTCTGAMDVSNLPRGIYLLRKGTVSKIVSKE